jgi:hypothetical protein
MPFISKRFFIHCLTIAAIVFSGLAPAISQAISIGQTGSGFAIEVCTSNGTLPVLHYPSIQQLAFG